MVRLFSFTESVRLQRCMLVHSMGQSKGRSVLSTYSQDLLFGQKHISSKIEAPVLSSQVVTCGEIFNTRHVRFKVENTTKTLQDPSGYSTWAAQLESL